MEFGWTQVWKRVHGFTIPCDSDSEEGRYAHPNRSHFGALLGALLVLGAWVNSARAADTVELVDVEIFGPQFILFDSNDNPNATVTFDVVMVLKNHSAGAATVRWSVWDIDDGVGDDDDDNDDQLTAWTAGANLITVAAGAVHTENTSFKLNVATALIAGATGSSGEQVAEVYLRAQRAKTGGGWIGLPFNSSTKHKPLGAVDVRTPSPVDEVIVFDSSDMVGARHAAGVVRQRLQLFDGDGRPFRDKMGKLLPLESPDKRKRGFDMKGGAGTDFKTAFLHLKETGGVLTLFTHGGLSIPVGGGLVAIIPGVIALDGALFEGFGTGTGAAAILVPPLPAYQLDGIGAKKQVTLNLSVCYASASMAMPPITSIASSLTAEITSLGGSVAATVASSMPVSAIHAGGYRALPCAELAKTEEQALSKVLAGWNKTLWFANNATAANQTLQGLFDKAVGNERVTAGVFYKSDVAGTPIQSDPTEEWDVVVESQIPACIGDKCGCCPLITSEDVVRSIDDAFESACLEWEEFIQMALDFEAFSDGEAYIITEIVPDGSGTWARHNLRRFVEPASVFVAEAVVEWFEQGLEDKMDLRFQIYGESGPLLLDAGVVDLWDDAPPRAGSLVVDEGVEFGEELSEIGETVLRVESDGEFIRSFVNGQQIVELPLVEPAGNVRLLVRRSPDEAPLGIVSWEHASFQPGFGCLADCNGDGLLNILDFICFQELFEAQDPAADCNGDGLWNILDFVCFQEAFQEGCE